MPRKKTNLTMPVLALRGLMVFPHMVLHFDVGRPKSVAALQEAMMNDQKIFLVAQKDVDDPDPTPENLCTVPWALAAAAAGAWAATALDVTLLRRPFGLFLLAAAVLTLRQK